MKASQTRIKNSIAEKGVTIDVGAAVTRENQLYLYETNSVQDARNKRVQLTGIEQGDAVSRG
jgi:hypothetical protein